MLRYTYTAYFVSCLLKVQISSKPYTQIASASDSRFLAAYSFPPLLTDEVFQSLRTPSSRKRTRHGTPDYKKPHVQQKALQLSCILDTIFSSRKQNLLQNLLYSRSCLFCLKERVNATFQLKQLELIHD